MHWNELLKHWFYMAFKRKLSFLSSEKRWSNLSFTRKGSERRSQTSFLDQSLNQWLQERQCYELPFRDWLQLEVRKKNIVKIDASGRCLKLKRHALLIRPSRRRTYMEVFRYEFPSPMLVFFFYLRFFRHTLQLNAFWGDRNGLFFTIKLTRGVEVVLESNHKGSIVISVIFFLIAFSL